MGGNLHGRPWKGSERIKISVEGIKQAFTSIYHIVQFQVISILVPRKKVGNYTLIFRGDQGRERVKMSVEGILSRL